MKKFRDFASLDCRAMVQELSAVAGARVQKVYQKGELFYFSLYKEGKKTLVLGPDRVHFTKYIPTFPKEPSNFCMYLRKQLSGSRLVSVEQHSFDRVLLFHFEGAEKRTLVVELFSDGNVILLNGDGLILRPLRVQQWKHRSVKPKIPYVFPPESADTGALSEAEFVDVLGDSGKDLVRSLATTLNFGGLYAEEICSRLEIEKNAKCDSIIVNKLKTVFASVHDVFNSLGKGYVYLNGSVPIDFSPIKLSKYVNEVEEEFKTFSEACDTYFFEEAKEEVEEQIDTARGKYETQLKTQEATLDSILLGIKEWSVEGDKLSQEKKFKEAAKLYEKVKRSKKKISGLASAVKKTKERLDKAASEVKDSVPQKKVQKKKTWIDAFRSFTSSDGFLVVAGKDATTNEMLVKKYTEPGDRVFHADFTGAPFCVVKAQGKEIPETTLEETATFAASYSKAWARGLGTVDVYAVSPDQVSKEAPAGESLGKGAFVIRGKKTNYRNVVLELAIGVLEDEVISGPKTMVQLKTKEYVLIGPGTEKSLELARKIKKKLNVDVNADDIQRVIPAGKGALKR